MKVLVGADPELFLKDNTTGKIVGAYNILPGTKQEPYKVKRGAIQVDGMAAEFNIDPAETPEEFDLNIQTVLDQLKAMLPSNIKIDYRSSYTFDKKYLKSFPEEYRELGCDPDLCAYSLRENPSPSPLITKRVVGGHIHIGWTEGEDTTNVEHVTVCAELCKQLDLYLALPSISLDPDRRRRSMYGGAGSFRVKPYGVEYRALSNYWIHDSELRKRIFNRVMLAVNDFSKDVRVREEDQKHVRDTINNYRLANCDILMRRYPLLESL